MNELFSKKSMGTLIVRPIEEGETPRWIDLMRKHHYLGFGKSAGKRILYVAMIDDEWVALLSWAAAALHVRCRDRWIGWDGAVKRYRLRQVTNNTRFLILPDVQIKNLASRTLSLNIRRIRADWMDRHGVDIFLAETFVDPSRFKGTCYLAQGWEAIGLTGGFGHDPSGGYLEHGQQKMMLVQQLVHDAARRLRQPLDMPDAAGVPPTLDVATLPIEHLCEFMRTYPPISPRKHRQDLETRLLALIGCGLLSGITSQRGLARFAETLRPEVSNRLGFGGKRIPSRWVFWRFINKINSTEFDTFITRWIMTLEDSGSAYIMKESIRRGGSPPLLTALCANFA